MTEPLPPDDLDHLPRAEEGPADPRAAKAALWKEIAARKKARQPTPAAPPPEPVAEEPPSQLPAPGQGWNELLATPEEELHGFTMVPDFSSPAPAPPPPRRRSIIRSGGGSAPVEPTVPPEPVASQEPVLETTPPADVPSYPEKEDREPPVEAPAANASKPPGMERQAVAAAEAAGPQTAADEPSAPKPQPGGPHDISAENTSPTAAQRVKDIFRQKWVQWGGASLSLSLGIHLLILGVGGFLVVNQVMLEAEVDFLPGGSRQGQEASQALEHKIQQKKTPWLRKPVPVRKIAAVGSISDIVLPDEVPDLLELPGTNDLLSAGKLGGGGLGGAGGGFGKGMGLGSKSGMVFQPLSMFGREIKAKRLALVLDVSGSMVPYLPRVIQEVDKVARDSIIILFPGCGLVTPPPRGIPGKEIYRTSGSEFERFWRAGGMASYDEARSFKFKKDDVIENESIFKILSRRPQTYFIHGVGIGYTWLALLSDQVRQADALYWFSDFQDTVDFTQVEIVRDNLKRRGQRLYIQPYDTGSALDLVRSQLVEPTGGDVIDVQF